jgi:hypothetical protein
MHSKLQLFVLSLIIIFQQCTESPEPDYDIFLSAEDYLCTYAKLKVTVPDSGYTDHFRLTRNNKNILETALIDEDTVITDKGLKPDTDYRYQAYYLKNSTVKDSSNEVFVHTRPTTSHNFVWELDSLGIRRSLIRDVWIVNENDIWAVGQIYMPDPDSSWSGTGEERFNAAHWDGNEWEIMRIVNSAPLYSIWYFNENDIWVSSGFPMHWDGNQWIRYHLQNMGYDVSTENIWGTSSSNMYFAGLGGSLVHYNGSDFTKIETGTEIDLKSISGTPDGEHVFITGYENSGELSGQSIALEITNGELKTLFSSDNGPFGNPSQGDYGRFQVVEVIDNIAYFTTGGTWILEYNIETKETEYSIDTEGFSFESISANSRNDILLTSKWANICHFNGEDWHIDNTFYNMFGPHFLFPQAGKIKDDIIVIGCALASWAYAPVIRGHRIP